MDIFSLEAALLRVADRAGVIVRHESFDRGLFHDLPRRGGLCRLRGVLTLFVDPSEAPADRVATLALGLARLDLDLARVAMPPFVRETIARQGAALRARRRPTLRRVVLHAKVFASKPGEKLEPLGRPDARAEHRAISSGPLAYLEGVGVDTAERPDEPR